jgi:hypothetical protein
MKGCCCTDELNNERPHERNYCLHVIELVTLMKRLMINVYVLLLWLQIRTEKKSPRKAGDNVLFMEHLVIPYSNHRKDILKVR